MLLSAHCMLVHWMSDLFGIYCDIHWLDADEMSGDPDRYILYLLALLSAYMVHQPEYVDELSSNYRQSLRVSNLPSPPSSPSPPPPNPRTYSSCPIHLQMLTCILFNHVTVAPSVLALLTMLISSNTTQELMPCSHTCILHCLSRVCQALH